MIARLVVLFPLLSLASCVTMDASSFASHNVEVRSHHSLPAAGVALLRVENIAGSITVDAWNRPEVDVRALEYGVDQPAIDRTHVDVSRSGSTIYVATRYDKNESFFSNNNGAEVDYTIHVPANIGVSLTNVSGPTAIAGVTGDVTATEISGRLDASLGRVTGSRNVNLEAVSGRITARIGRNSDARVDASTISGDVSLFFPSNMQHGVVGNAANGTIGAGSASMKLHTVSGSIAVDPQ